MLGLRISDVLLDESGTGVIRLDWTKTGQRHAAFEAATLNDPVSGRLFSLFLASLPAGTSHEHYVFMPNAHVFYRMFDAGLRWLGLVDFGFKPYSIRRGGATAYFRCTRNMEATLDRGRWSSARVARIYVNDGLAKEVELRLPKDIDARLTMLVAEFSRWLAAQ